MNSYLYFIIIVIGYLFPTNGQSMGYCDKKLKPAFETLLSLEETKQLWERINQEGHVRIVANRGGSNHFMAYWEGEQRIICVNLDLKASIGDQVSSILFEMHNALRDRKVVKLYNQASKRSISKDTFAKEMERLEYQNSLDASHLLEKGKKSGFYPKDCYLERFDNFEAFLQVQKMHGHYQHYLRTYSEIQGITFSS